jgi:hypothetical protein
VRNAIDDCQLNQPSCQEPQGPSRTAFWRFSARYRATSRASFAPRATPLFKLDGTLGLLEIAVTENDKALLERIAQMLTKLIKARRPNI